MKKNPSVNNTSSLLKIGDAAKILGVSIDTLRRWEKAGKIKAQRTPGGTRLYSLSALKRVNPDVVVTEEAEDSISTEELLKKAESTAPLLSSSVIPAEAGIHTNNDDLWIPDQVGDDKVVKTKKSFVTKFLISSAVFSFITLILTAWITASYLTSPKETAQFFKNNIASGVFKPFHILAEETLMVIDPKKAKELGFIPPDESPPLIVAKDPNKNSNVLAVTSTSPFLEVNADTQILGSLFVRDSINGLSFEATPSAGTIALNAGSTSLTVTNSATLDQDVSTTATPTFSTLALSATTNQLSTGSLNFTLPATSGTLVTKDSTDTLKNKSMSGASNTFTAIPNSALSNNKVTVTAGTNLTGGGDAELGSSVTLALKASPAVTNLTASGIVSLADGTAAAPSLTFTNDLNSGLYSLAADKIGLITGGTATQGITIDANGNVGIGTISPSQKLEVNGTAKVTTLNATSAIQLNGVDITTGGTLTNIAYLDQANIFTANQNFSSGFDVDDAFVVADGGALTTSQSATFNGALYFGGSTGILTSTGNVGIGNTNPGNNLTVGDLLATSTDKRVSIGNSSGNSTLTLGQDSSNRANLQWVYNATAVNAYLALGTLDSQALALQKDGGNVGIGTTSPAYQLETTGNVGIGGSATVTSTLTAGSIQSRGALVVDGTSYLQAVNAGNITAGTYNGNTITTGTGTLTLANALITSGNYSLTLTTTGTTNVTLPTTGTLSTLAGTETLSNKTFSGNTYFPNFGIWDSNGNLGIGTTAADYNLKVMGTGYFSDFVGIGSSLNISGNVGIGQSLTVGSGASFSSSLNVSGNTNLTTLNATTFNGNTWTPGTGTLTIAAGKTLTASNTITLAAGADGQTFTFPSSSTTIAGLGTTQTFAGVNTFDGNLYFGGSTGILSSGGNIGIGTTSPSQKLDVAGNINISTGLTYKIAGTDVLSGTTLGSGVVTSSLTTVGALASGSIASGFGTISTGNTITTTGTMGTAGTTTFTGAGGTFSANVNANGGLDVDDAFVVADGGALTTSQTSTFNGALYFGGSTGILASGGNVGIGTTDPAYQLQTTGNVGIGGSATVASALIAGSIQNNGALVVDGTSYLQAVNAGNITAGTYNGNTITTGTGTLTLGAGKTFTANNTITLAAGADGQTFTFPSSSTTIAGLGTTQTFSGVNTFDGNLYFGGSTGILSSGGNIGIGTTNPVSALQVMGNVGIGATTSSNKLDVWGNARIAGTGTIDSTLSVAGITTLSASNGALSFTGSTPSITSGSSVLGLFAGGNIGIGTTGNLYGGLTVKGAGTTTGITLQTYGSGLGQGLTVLDNGNVGIGTTNPTKTLYVTGTGSFSGNVDVASIKDTENGNYLLDPANTGTAFAIAGNAGIGTTSPNSLLSVAGGAHIGALYQSISAPANGLFVDGNVGIGATTSSNKLDVWGNARIAGTLTTDGAVTGNTFNGMTITGSTGTFTLANGKTFTVNNSLTFSGTDSTTMTFPATSTTVAGLGTTQTFSGANTFNGNLYFGGTTGILSSGGNVGIGTTNPTSPFYLNAKQTSGTLSSIHFDTATTLTDSLTGHSVDLNDGTVTATNQDVTVLVAKLPTVTNTNADGTVNLRGIYSTFGSGAGINQNGAGATVYSAADFVLPALTQTSGTLTANGVLVTTPSSITTGGTANALNISATGVGAGSLNAVNISNITGSGGTETAFSVGTGWDTVLKVGSTTVINGSGVTQVAGGGTGIASYSVGDILYASATGTLTNIGIGTSGQVLTSTSGIPSWATISGSSCVNCLTNNPTADQTISPTGQGTTGLSVRQTSTADPTDDIFNVTSSDGGTKYFYVDKDGNVSTGGTSSTTITLTPTSNTTALTLVGTNVTTQKLAYFNAANTEGTIFDISYGSSKMLTNSLTGQSINLGVGATNQSVTGASITLPSPTNTGAGTYNYKGIVVSANGGLNNTGAGTTNILGADITIPAITQTAGTVSAYGVKVTTPSSITTGGTAYGLGISSTGISAGTLYGIDISAITAGAGAERAINIGTGWDYGIYSATTNPSYFAGNIGIGATTSDNKLDVWGDARITGALTVDGDFTLGGTNNGAQFLAQDGTAAAPGYSFTNDTDSGLWRIDDNRLALTTSGNAMKGLTINTNGNVGIGTTNAGAVLELYRPTTQPKFRSNYDGVYADFGLDNQNAANYGAGIWVQGTQQAHFYGRGLSLGSFVTHDAPTDGIAVSGNVGIGTSTPNSKLTVVGNALIGNTWTGLSAPTSGLFVEGNVGIGATTSSNKLDVWGNARIAGTGTIDSTLSVAGITTLSASNGALSFTGSTPSLTSGSSVFGLFAGGNVGIGTTGNLYGRLTVRGAGTSTNIALQTYGSGLGQGLTVLDNGNVGIGTTGPAASMEIFKNQSVSGGAELLRFNNPANGDTGSKIEFYQNTTEVGKIANYWSESTGWVMTLGSGNGGTLANVAIDGAGNLGIGTLTPKSSLYVTGNAMIGYSSGAPASLANGLAVSGNVGIGTTDPRGALDLGTSENDKFILYHGNTTADDYGIGIAASEMRLFRDAGSIFTFYDGGFSGTEKMRLDASGNVGIGTTDPATKLHAISASNQLRIGNNVSNYANFSVADPTFTISTGGFTNITLSPGGTSTMVLNTSGVTISKSGGTGSVFDYTSGNVGIGTTSPNSVLSVAGGAHIGSIRQGISAPTDGLFVDGNVGIGATTSSNKLDVWGNTRIAGTLTVDSTLTNSSVFRAANGSASLPAYSFTNLTNAGLWTNGDGLLLTTGGSNTSGITVTGAGNIGIGTTSPGTKLHVYGGTFAVNAGDPSYSIDLRATTDLGLGVSDAAGNVLYADASNTYLKSASNIWFQVPGGSDTGKITASGLFINQISAISGTSLSLQPTSGNVGIGTTAPQAKLVIQGNVGIGYTGVNQSIPVNGLAVFGNVGIGTTTANSLLSVAGGAHIGSVRQGISAPTDGLFVDGNVGIGATTSSNKLDVWGNTRIAGTLTVDSTLTNSSVFRAANGSASLPAYSFTNLTNAGLWTNGDGLLLTTGGTDTSGLTVTGAGNVGIGTTTPSANLEVRGTGATNLRLTGTTTPRIDFYWDDGASVFRNGYIGADGNINGLIFDSTMPAGAGGAGPLEFKIDGSSKMWITAGGNIGIGTTTANSLLSVAGGAHIGGTYQGISAPTNGLFVDGNVGIGATTSSNKLDVWGNARIAGTLTVDSTFTGSSVFRAANGSASLPAYSFTNLTNAGLWTNGDGLLLTTGGSNTSGITVTGAGNIGIGTTAPALSLDVLGTHVSSTGMARFKGSANVGFINLDTTTTTAGGASGVYFKYGGSAKGNIQYDYDTDSLTLVTSASTIPISFYINSEEKMRLSTTGNVGIGFSSPAATLDVIGTTLLRGTAGTYGLAVTNAGRIGIGTTSPLSSLHIQSAGKSQLRIDDTSAQAAGVGGAIVFGGNYRTNNDVSPFAKIAAEKTNSTDNNYSYNLAFYTTNNTGANPSILPQMIIDNNGNVGIGTTGPSALLSVGSTSQFQVNSSGAIAASTGISNSGGYTQTGSSSNTFTGETSLGNITNIGWVNFAGSTSQQLWGNWGIKYSGASDRPFHLSNASLTVGYLGDGTTYGTNNAFIAGNIGVGTTTANNKLQVIGAGVFGANYGQYSAASNGLLVEGNIGIGATTSSNKLDVWGNARIAGTLTVDSTLTNSSVFRAANGSASLPAYSFTNLTNAGLWTNGDGLLLTTGGSSTSGITVTGAGNIGIGTTAPLSTLHLLAPDGAGTQDVLWLSGSRDNSTSGARIVFNNKPSQFPTWRVADIAGIYNSATDLGGDLIFRTNDGATQTGITEKLRITYNGNVGIGVSGPSKALEVNGDILMQNGGYLYGKGTNGAVTGLIKTTANNLTELSTSHHAFFVNYLGVNATLTGAPASALVVNGGLSLGADYYGVAAPTNGAIIQGNVGIGTTGPAAKLELSNSAADVSLNLTAVGGSAMVIKNTYATDNFDFLNPSTWGTDGQGAQLRFFTNGDSTTPKMVITKAGNIGIGTTGPGAKLGFTAATTAAGGIDFGGDTNLYRADASVLKTDDEFRAARLYLASAGDISGVDAVYIRPESIDNGVLYLQSGVNTANSKDGIRIQTKNASDTLVDRLTFQAGANTANVTFQNSNVGIGTSAPDRLLHAASTINIVSSMASLMGVGGTQFDISGATTNSSKKLVLGIDTTNNYGVLQAGNTDGTGYDLSLNPAGGNVGIGTTSPAFPLDVYGAAAGNNPNIQTRGDIMIGTGGSTSSIFFGGTYDYSAGDYIRRIAAGQIEIFGGGTNAAATQLVVNNGNVGIGFTSPAATLDVIGTSLLRGTAGTYGLAVTNAGLVGIGMTNPTRSLQIGTATPGYAVGSDGAFVSGGMEVRGSFYVTTGGGTYVLSADSNGIDIYGGTRQYRLGQVMVLNETTLGSGVVNSSLTSVGTLTSLAVSGTTTLSANNAALSFTGTTPSLTSGSSVFGLFAGGNVGIGTTGNLYGGLTVRGAGTGTNITLQTYGSGLGQGLSVLDNGNVGIGTTDPEQTLHVFSQSYNGLTYPLKITNNPLSGAGNNEQVGMLFNIGNGDDRGKGGLIYAGDGTGWNKGDFHFLQNSAGDATNPTLANSVLTIKNSGNVGIGTTAPTGKLNVNSGDLSSTNTGVFFQEASAGTNWIGNYRSLGIVNTDTTDGNFSSIVFQDGVSSSAAAGIWGIYRNHESDYADLAFMTHGADGFVQRMNITNAGNVGIGFTSPAATLDVIGTTLLRGTAGTYGLAVTNAGRIGIGTTAPLGLLQVNGGNVFVTGSTSQTVIGGTTPMGVDGNAARFTIVDTSADYNTNGTFTFANSTTTPYWVLGKSRGATAGTYTFPSAGDELGILSFAGATDIGGGRFTSGAIIQAETEQTWDASNRGTSLQFQTSTGTTLAEKMRITGAGNVGIGTTGPASKLSVLGNAAIGATYGSAFSAPTSGLIVEGNVGIGTTPLSTARLSISGENGGRVLQFSDSGLSTNDIYAVATHVASEGLSLSFYENAYTSGTGVLLTLHPVGLSVGVGTAGPDRKLDVLEANNPQLRLSQADGTVYTDFQTYSSGNLTITPSGGNVGIGFTSPASKLHVFGAGAVSQTIESTDNDALLNIKRSSSSLGALVKFTTGGTTDWNLGLNYLLGSSFALYEDGQDSSPALMVNTNGNVGIGTTDPIGLLHVAGNSTPSLFIENTGTSANQEARLNFRQGGFTKTRIVSYADDPWSSGNNRLSFITGDGSTERLVITNGGNVGIGTTGPRAGGSGATLDIRNSLYIGNAGVAHGYINTDDNLYINIDANNDSSGNAFIIGHDGTGAQSELFRVNESGNVGIGFTSPTDKLYVNGDIRIASSQGRLYLTGGTDQGSNSIYAGNDGNLNIIADNDWIVTDAKWGYSFQIDASNKMTLDSNGNLGLGTGISPTAQLHVQNTNTSTGLHTYIGSSAGQFAILDNGNVGIGTSAPGSGLNVYGNTEALSQLTVQRYDGAARTITMTPASSSKYASITTSSTLGFLLNTQGYQELYLNGAGNVGIGTTSPGYPLHVLKNQNDGSGIYMQNTTAGTGAYAYFTAVADAASTDLYSFSSSYTTNGAYVADGGALVAPDSASGGLSLASTNTSGVIRFYTGSLTNERMRIDPNGSLNIGYAGNAAQGKLSINGNVGIGTTSPATKLEILSTNNADLRLGEGGSLFTNIRWNIGSNQAEWDTDSYTYPIKLNGSNIVLQDASGGNVGIGTQAPLAALQVNSTGSNPFVVQSGGNVGIGTTSPGTKLDIVVDRQESAVTAITQSVGNSGIGIQYIRNNYAWVPGMMWYTPDNNPTLPKAGFWYYEGSGGTYLQWGTSNNYAGGITNVGLTLNPSGNLGIGATVPGSSLHVAGNAMIGYADGGTPASLANGLAVSGNVGIGTTKPRQTLDVRGGRLALDAEQMITWYQVSDPNTTTGNGLVRHFTGGDASYYGFDAYQGTTVRFYDSFGMSLGSTYAATTAPANGAIIQGNVGIGNAAPTGLFHVGNTGTPPLFVTSGTGNVGIGTTGPQSKLTIENDATDARQLILQEATDPNFELYLGWDSNGDYGAIQSYQQATGARNLILQQEGGNVGIGWTSPSATLQVEGTVAVSGTSGGLQLRPRTTTGGTTNFTWYNPTGGYLQLDNAGTTVITNTGNVGIGIAAPVYKTHFAPGLSAGTVDQTVGFTDSDGTASYGGYIGQRVVAANTRQGLVVSGTGSLTLNAQNYSVDFIVGAITATNDTNLKMRVDSTGVKVTSGYSGGTVGALDYAELYPATEDVDKGDLVVIDETASTSVKKSNAPYSPLIIGIVSTDPASVIEGDQVVFSGSEYQHNPRKPAVALAGRVPLKVSTENGNIGIGDYLTSSSVPGVAMKATRPGQVVGQALEAYSGAGTGTVTVFVNVSYVDPNSLLAKMSGNADNLNQTGNFNVSGNVGIGTTSPGDYALYVNGSGFLNDTGWTYASDSRLKENVASINTGLDVITALNPVTFDYINGGANRSGFIAQEVQKVLPDLVSQRPDGMLTLRTEEILPFAVQAIKQLNDKISNLQIDADGTLIVEKLKAGTITLDPNITLASTTSDGGTQSLLGGETEVSVDNTEVNVMTKLASLEERIQKLESNESEESKVAGEATSSAQLADSTAEATSSADIADALELTDPAVLLATSSASLIINQKSLIVSEATVSATLTAYDLNVQNGLKSLGKTTLADTTVAGTLTVDGTLSIENGSEINVIGTLYLQKSILADGLDIFDGKVTIDSLGNMLVTGTLTATEVKTNKLTITNTPVATSSANTSGVGFDSPEVNGASIGSAILPAGSTSVTIPTGAISNTAKVFVTATTTTDKVLSVGNVNPGTSFNVVVTTPGTSDIKFNWWIVETN